MDEAVVLYTTWPDAETAEAAARRVVEARLAACVNILAPHRAVYRWDGTVETAEEVAALFKTSRARSGALRDWITAHHAYDLPAIVALAAAEGSSPAYLAWIAAASEPPQADGMAGREEETR